MSDRTRSPAALGRTLVAGAWAGFLLYDAPSGGRPAHLADERDGEAGAAHVPVERRDDRRPHGGDPVVAREQQVGGVGHAEAVSAPARPTP